MPVPTRVRELSASPWAWVVVGWLVAAVIVGFRLPLFHGKAAGFAVAGHYFTDASRAPAELPVRARTGFDGQFYYRLSIDPLPTDRTRHGITFDVAPYRAQRVGYPWIAYALTHTTPLGVGSALILINVIGFGVCAGLGAAYTRALGRAPPLGAAVALVPATAVALSLDTSEIVEYACLLSGLLLWDQGRRRWATVAFTYALLTRETALLVVGGLAVVELRRWVVERDWSRILALGVPVLVWAGWQAGLTAVWGRVPVLTSPDDFTFPFAGIVDGLSGPPEPGLRPVAIRIALAVLIGLVGLVVAASIRTTDAPVNLVLTWAVAAALAVVFSGSVWVDENGFFRALGEYSVAGWYVVLCRRDRDRIPLEVAALLAVCWASTAVSHIRGF